MQYSNQWEAVDLHYWETVDLEWYDPDAATTRDGKLEITLSEQVRLETLRRFTLISLADFHTFLSHAAYSWP